MSGYSEVELLGMRIADIEAVENKTDVNDHISKIKKLQADRFETKHKRKDGFIYDVEITVKYINNDKFVVFIRDITETKNAKTAKKLYRRYSFENRNFITLKCFEPV